MSADNPAFWEALEALVAGAEIIVDRPRHTPHPRRPELIYPLDYGFLAGTGDGEDIDVWLGTGAGEPRVRAIACTADVWKRDAEFKLLLACSEEEIATIAHFLNETVGLPCVVLRRRVSPTASLLG